MERDEDEVVAVRLAESLEVSPPTPEMVMLAVWILRSGAFLLLAGKAVGDE
jgi:hypothetical protein